MFPETVTQLDLREGAGGEAHSHCKQIKHKRLSAEAKLSKNDTAKSQGEPAGPRGRVADKGGKR